MTDSLNASTTSNAVPLTVKAPNQAPLITLNNTGNTFTAPATINLSATAADADGTIQSVAFFQGRDIA